MMRLLDRLLEWSIRGSAWRIVPSIAVFLALSATVIGLISLPFWYFDPNRGKPCIRKECGREIIYVSNGVPIYGTVCHCVEYGEKP
jgi:hypothetical protein